MDKHMNSIQKTLQLLAYCTYRYLCWSRSAVIALILSVTASSAAAACSDVGQDDIYNLFSQQKNDVLVGDYISFFDFANSAQSKDVPDAEAIQNALQVNFPNGFEKCQTLVSNFIEPSGLSELILYQDTLGNGLFVGWQGFEFLGQPIMGKYWITTEFQDVSELFR